MQNTLLSARIDDLCRQSERGECAVSNFLTPAEGIEAARYMRFSHPDALFRLAGGYNDAERVRLCVLAPWMSYMDADELTLAAAAYVFAVRVRCSGYVELGHRDYLGAVLALGLERSHIGDICVLGSEDDGGAIIFCTEAVRDFLCSEQNPFTSVGRDRVHVVPYDVPPDFDGARKYQRVSGTAASMRLDSVTAALIGQSRERVKAMIAAGNIELNYEVCLDPDRDIDGGEIISARGYGKFKLVCDGSRTKKDRERVTALKYL